MAKSKVGVISFEVVNFEAEMARIEQEIMEGVSDDVNDLIEYAGDSLRVVTPVDTGEARLGWATVPSNVDVNGQVVGELVNEVEHIGPLNNGHSKQAPRFFIEQVLSTIGLITKD